jgi:cytochrome c553
MNGKIVLATLFSVACAAFAAAAQEGDPKAGEFKAMSCTGCHSIPGHSNVYPSYHVPRVGGQHAQYIIAALNAYKNGDRSHKTMQAQAATLSDQDIADIAAYFAAAKSD